MKQATILDIAKETLSKYDLDDWTVALDTIAPGETKRLARTWFLHQEISLMRSYWQSRSDTEDWRKELRSSMLHEIAHILEGSDEGHGERWRDRYIALLEEWFDKKRVVAIVCCSGDIPADWIRDWLPKYRTG
jgi:hypothetical protein